MFYIHPNPLRRWIFIYWLRSLHYTSILLTDESYCLHWRNWLIAQRPESESGLSPPFDGRIFQPLPCGRYCGPHAARKLNCERTEINCGGSQWRVGHHVEFESLEPDTFLSKVKNNLQLSWKNRWDITPLREHGGGRIPGEVSAYQGSDTASHW